MEPHSYLSVGSWLLIVPYNALHRLIPQAGVPSEDSSSKLRKTCAPDHNTPVDTVPKKRWRLMCCLPAKQQTM